MRCDKSIGLPKVKFSYTSKIILLGLLVLEAALLTACTQAARQKQSTPKQASLTSRILGATFIYDASEFTSVVESEFAEFPVIFEGRRWNLGIKKLAGIGRLLTKEPDLAFYQYFSGEVVYSFRDKNKMRLLEKETIEEFKAKGKNGAIQFLHFSLPAEKHLVPRFIPKDTSEIYLYYFHFLYPPDYWYFVVISKIRLEKPELDKVISLIEKSDLQAKFEDQQTTQEIK